MQGRRKLTKSGAQSLILLHFSEILIAFSFDGISGFFIFMGATAAATDPPIYDDAPVEMQGGASLYSLGKSSFGIKRRRQQRNCSTSVMAFALFVAVTVFPTFSISNLLAHFLALNLWKMFN